MAIRVALNHQTVYRYDRLVALDSHVIRLRPAPHCRTPVLSYSLKIQPQDHFLNWQQDPYSNYLARLVFPSPTTELRVEVDLIAELTVLNPFDFFVENYADQYPFRYDAVLARELLPFLETQPAGPRLQALIDSSRRNSIRSVDYLVEINARLKKAIGYVIRMEPGIQTPEETLTLGRGSCRDTAWLMVQLLRHLGLAARFVSGYLIQLTADVKALDGPSGPTADFTDLHAWAEVYLPGAGWVGFDPTSGLLAGEGHLPLACAADPITAAPITGSFSWAKNDDASGEVGQEFVFHMSVERIHEDPRVTRPYKEEQWRAIEDLGHWLDDENQAEDIRLTMGGEPTFVSIDDMEGEEWNFTAMGPNKRKMAGVLLKRLRARFAPGGLLHYGLGKWYPGEPLPRWALACYWRRDGEGIWNDMGLVADETVNRNYGPAQAWLFVTALAKRLDVDPALSIPGYEDVWYHLWKERRLPVNVDPLKSKLADVDERKRLARIFEQGLDHVVGYALPLERRRFSPARWVGGRWFFRQEHMFLLPGDSPMGLRLPLDSLPWANADDQPELFPPDPFAPRPPLPRVQQQFLRAESAPRSAALAEQTAPDPDLTLHGSAAGVIRAALCVESRQGQLHVFLPPLRYVEDFLDLVTAIENTAAALQIPVSVEGYPPPHDPRLNHFKLTPDPGVLEVNIHPAHNWNELVKNTTALYEEARQARLGTEKFMRDGRHTGTGGGNHIVLGGPTPADSPMLRRPDLLRSLVGYWHNHPALSYLFSGLFLGPTSQAPRVDEARNDSIYELDIAFRQISEPLAAARSANGRNQGPPTPAWLVDRAFRHLLVDVTGNTHRAEFCIDKLYSPDSSTGRLGLVEMRAFEMPPHARMSLVQQLLLRALIVRFWKEPYKIPLVRWGTELHDRFMLPHFVHQDFQDVIRELNQAGMPFRDEWFAPHFEFRFPPLGSVTHQGVHLELRTAIEPWHVLGEEVTANGQARYVDSSVERLQVKVRGMINPRHVVTCNSRRVPLHPTGVNGEFVAGVRYRAWQPPSCLHPLIGVHSPLIFDLVDSWQERALGGCTYHVQHPGGRNPPEFPVNANEAESRRAARFFAFGHTPGPMTLPPEERVAEAPFTLDLRRTG
jgi:uncharacterized protein (DUF2126 family)/transglutaminase-like putative cysteine protease